jgi:hypothetical protein
LVTKFTSILTVTHVTTGTMVIIDTINVLNLKVILVTKLTKFPMVAIVRDVISFPIFTVVIFYRIYIFTYLSGFHIARKPQECFAFRMFPISNTDIRTLKISFSVTGSIT